MPFAEFHSSRSIKKSRKEHTCFLCLLKIPQSSACMYEAGKYDNEIFSRHSHNECSKKWNDINYDAQYGDDWLELESMAEVYPHDNFEDWKKTIRIKYGIGRAYA